MKKKLLMIVAVVAMTVVAANAQPRAIGVNLGSGLGFSYQHGFGEANMLDIDVHVPVFGWGVGGIVTYDWIDPFGTQIPWNNKGEWHWALGVGAAGGIYGFSNPDWYAGVAGHVGVAYDFWFPLELSVDWRPNFGVVGWNAAHNGGVGFNLNGLYDGVTIGVRYLFNQN